MLSQNNKVCPSEEHHVVVETDWNYREKGLVLDPTNLTGRRTSFAPEPRSTSVPLAKTHLTEEQQ